MEKIYLQEAVDAGIRKCGCPEILDSLPIPKYIIRYEPGEFLADPLRTELTFQIVAEGMVDIYFIRDDGTRYALSSGGTGYMIGDMDFFEKKNRGIFVEAAQQVACIAWSIDRNREILLNHAGFLQMVVKSLSAKMAAVTEMNAAPSSLEERVATYMRFKCENGVLKGIERTAFHLHCSARQLQRIMNRLEAEGKAVKIGKGCYRLKL